MKRSYSLDLVRLFLAYVITLFHFDHTIPPGPTVTVQIFFVISGYFLARKYYTHSHEDRGATYSPLRYTLDHVRSFYPHYLLAAGLFLLYTLTRASLVFLRNPSARGLWDLSTLIYDQLPDALFLQASYQYAANLNSPTWQISALIIAGYFVYALLCHNEKLSRTILFPGAIIMTQSILVDCNDLFARIGPIFLPLLRAFAPMCMGVLTYSFSQSSYCAQLKQSKFIFNLLTLLALPMMIFFEDRNGLHLIWSALLILGCTEPSSALERLLGHRIFAGCAKLSYVIYLNHALISRAYINIISKLILKAGIVLGDTINCIVYLTILTLACLLLMWVMERLTTRHRVRA